MLLIEIENLNELADALAHFVHREAINEYRCSNCNQFAKIDKNITMHELSSVLIINFKRCALTFDETERLVHQVNFNELFDISRYMISQSCTPKDKDDDINSLMVVFINCMWSSIILVRI